jgi:monoamine oxidase
MTEDVYMIAYSDNSNANYINNHVTGNDKESREFLSGLLEKGLDASCELPLTAIKRYYWPIGTHYMRPFMEGETYESWIRLAQHPAPNIVVVGEAFSRNQGWVEGALESVELALRR